MKLRILGNILLLSGQGILLYNNVSLGIIIKLIGGGLIMSEFIKSKDFDMVITMSAFFILDASRLLTLVLSM